MGDFLRSRINKVASAVFATLFVMLSIVRPVAILAIPGTMDDAEAWLKMADAVPGWIWDLLLFTAGGWVAVTWYEPVKNWFSPKWPDFREIDAIDRFRLGDAACYFANMEPTRPLRGGAREEFRQMEKALWENRLKLISSDLREQITDRHKLSQGRPVKADPEWIVDRESLIEYADSVGKKPPFLFRRERV